MSKSKEVLVKEILSIKKVDTKSNLSKKTNKELEKILSGLTEKAPTGETEVDVKALKEKMKAELMEELKEKARKEVEAEVRAESKEDENKPKRKKDIDRFEPIPVMNVSKWGLIYVSKRSGGEYIWSRFGDVEYIEFQELLTMRSSQRAFLDEPFVLILDQDVVDYMGLDKKYESFDKKQVESLDDIFRMRPTEFEKTVESLPKGIQHTVVSRARELYEDGELDSLRKINYLNERFNTDINSRG